MNDGGPAFPSLLTGKVDERGRFNPDQTDGMSLRDWFAGQALNGYFAYYSAEDCIMPNKEEFAQRCYKFADAMLAERAKAK